MKLVIITGAAGFIGRHVARLFAVRGYTVYGIGRGKFPEYGKWGLCLWKQSDITVASLKALVDTPDVIVHCAGGAAVGYSINYPREDFRLTVDTTSHVLEYIRLHSPSSRLVYPSTAAVYGRAREVPIAEGSPREPVSPYGVHKLMAENMCQLYAKQYELNIAIVRLFSIYGSGLRKQLLWDACQKYLKGESLFFGTGNEVRDWLHVNDAASLLLMAESKATTKCPIVNGGSGEGVKVRDVLEALLKELHLMGQPRFSSLEKAGDPQVLVANIDSAKNWGWQPQLNLSAGLAEYAAWYLQSRD